jgi:hypothetical protein
MDLQVQEQSFNTLTNGEAAVIRGSFVMSTPVTITLTPSGQWRTVKEVSTKLEVPKAKTDTQVLISQLQQHLANASTLLTQ